MEDGVFENSFSAFGSLLSDAVGGVRDVLVAREDRRARETDALLRAQFGLPPVAQPQSAAATTAPLPATPALGSNVIVIGLIGVVAAVLLLR